jgi:uncharacterized protein DUF4386
VNRVVNFCQDESGGTVMDDKLWEKLAALGGVAFVVLNVVGTIIQGEPPSPDDSGEKVLDWFVDHDTSIKFAAFLGGLSLIALAWWFGSLWRRMARAENGNHRLSVVALGSLFSAGALFAASTAILSTVALRTEETSADGARFFYLLSTVLLSFAGFWLVAHLAAVNALSLRTGFLPQWLTFVGLLAAVLFLVSSIGSATDEQAIMIFGFIGFVAWSIWILGVSFYMWRTADGPTIEVVEVVEVTMT